MYLYLSVSGCGAIQDSQEDKCLSGGGSRDEELRNQYEKAVKIRTSTSQRLERVPQRCSLAKMEGKYWSRCLNPSNDDFESLS
jgi:hypothetical protein